MKLCKNCANKGKKNSCKLYTSLSNYAEKCKDFKPKDDAEWSITAMDNTGFKLDCKYGIITLSDRYGNGICDFMASDISKCIGNQN